jgi:ATP-dependent DNA helicase RecQ
VVRAGLDQLSTFGVLAGRRPAEIMAVLRALLANGWIDLTDGDFPVPRITPLGWQAIRGEIPVRLRLPSVPRRERAAQAQLPVPAPAPAPAPETPGSSSLFEALRAHRAAIARVRAVPPYVIAPDRTLQAIAAARPRTDLELLRCHGMGPARLAAYGDGLLAVVRAHASPEDAPLHPSGDGHELPADVLRAPVLADAAGVRTDEDEARPVAVEAAPVERTHEGARRVRGADQVRLDDLAYARFWQLVQRV